MACAEQILLWRINGTAHAVSKIGRKEDACAACAVRLPGLFL